METSDVFTLFRNKLQQASEDALRYAVSKDDSQARWGHHGWPTLQYFNNGMPRLGEAFGFSGPPDYSRLFDRGPDQDKAPKFPSVDELVNLVLVMPLLRDRLLFSRTVDWEKITSEHLDFLTFPIRHIPESLAARHIRSFGLGPMTNDTFEQLYAPLETFLFSDRLPLNVVVPILFLHFDFDEYRVDDRIMLRRLEPGFHLARYAINPFHREVNRCVMSAATHSFVGSCVATVRGM